MIMQVTVITSPMYFLFLHTVFNVSAQGSCTITIISPSTLTTAGRTFILPSGTENVMILCDYCIYGHGIVLDNLRWYDPAGTSLVIPANSRFIAGTPHVTRTVLNNVTLVIPTFNDSYDGIYTCGNVSNGLTEPPNAAVNFLTINSELMINTINYLYAVA